MKGCYVYFTDKAAERFFRSRLKPSIGAVPLSKVADSSSRGEAVTSE